MSFAWDSTLAVGVPTIDAHHQELFLRFDALSGALREQRSFEEMFRMLSFLGEYVASHFDEEEKLMSYTRYPDMEAHIEQHCVFIVTFDRLRSTFARSGITPEFCADIDRMVSDWLVEHMGKFDRALANHVRAAAP